jgi:hypothetical protein
MVRLTTIGDPIGARILTARLGSDGVVWEVRGGLDGPYPMGPFHVYVDEGDFEAATDILTMAGERVDDGINDDGADELVGDGTAAATADDLLDPDVLDEASPADDTDDADDGRRRRARPFVWLVVLSIVALAAFDLARMVLR